MMRLVLLPLSLFLIQCSTLNVYRGEVQKNLTSDVMKVETSHFLWGILPANPSLVEDQLCPGSRLDAAQMGMTGGDVLLTAVTLGIYVPSRVTVTCSK